MRYMKMSERIFAFLRKMIKFFAIQHKIFKVDLDDGDEWDVHHMYYMLVPFT
jgi:hypothetical protein